MKCERSAAIVAIAGKQMGCPTDAEPVIISKARGDVPAILCSGHQKAYRAAGITIKQQEA